MLILSTPNAASLTRRLKRGLRPLVSRTGYTDADALIEEHHREYTLPDLRRLVHATGLRIVKEDGVVLLLPFPNTLERITQWRPSTLSTSAPAACAPPSPPNATSPPKRKPSEPQRRRERGGPQRDTRENGESRYSSPLLPLFLFLCGPPRPPPGALWAACGSFGLVPMEVTVLSLNIWNYRGDWRERRERIAQVIREAVPDVVGLQEVRRDPRYAAGVNQATQLARLTGLHVVYVPAMRYWRLPRLEEGLAVLTPHRVIHRIAIPLRWNRRDTADPNRRIALRTRIALPDGTPLECWVTHLNQGAPWRERSAARLHAELVGRSSLLPPLLMGDLNARPDDPTLQPLHDTGLRDMWPI